MIGVVDYGAGNLFSLGNSLDSLDIAWKLVQTPAEVEAADAIILPGVGAFPDAMALLRGKGLVEPLRQAAEEKPFLGICLGMQMLFEKSYEFGETEGLGLIPGDVRPLPALPAIKIPHMGWNELMLAHPCPLLDGVPLGAWVYFVHSFAASTPDEYVAAYAEHGIRFPALVQRGHICGAQFHPEKSGRAGLRMLANFAHH